jgi:hypothetical protein
VTCRASFHLRRLEGGGQRGTRLHGLSWAPVRRPIKQPHGVERRRDQAWQARRDVPCRCARTDAGGAIGQRGASIKPGEPREALPPQSMPLAASKRSMPPESRACRSLRQVYPRLPPKPEAEKSPSSQSYGCGQCGSGHDPTPISEVHLRVQSRASIGWSQHFGYR